jgi:hypothetical protein
MWSTNIVSKARYEAVNIISEKRRSKQDKSQIGHLGIPSEMGSSLEGKRELSKFLSI